MIERTYKDYTDLITHDLKKEMNVSVPGKIVRLILLNHLKNIILSHYKYRNVSTTLRGLISIKPLRQRPY